MTGQTERKENRESEKREWQVFGESVEGASHKRSGMPNQDALLWYPGCEIETRYPDVSVPMPSTMNAVACTVLAVADGHGSARYARSHFGAQIAVKVATVACRQYCAYLERDRSIDPLRIAREMLPAEIARTWNKAVDTHYAAHPFTADEQARIETSGPDRWSKALGTPRLAYGATLLTAVATERFLLFLQLGDGDILTVSESGEVKRPMPSDSRLMANETTSLCSQRAENDFRIEYLPILPTSAPPALALLSTDGLVNSYAEEEGFLRAAKDIWTALRMREGVQGVQGFLSAWLKETSEKGSGDDITFAALFRPASLQTASTLTFKA